MADLFSPVEKIVFKTIRNHHLWNFKDPLILAVSGGRDSTALACILKNLADPVQAVLNIVYFDHASRKNSQNDRDFVAALAERLGCPFHSRRLDRLKPRGVSSEAFWRKERYRFLERMRYKLRCRWIVTGHTADDQLETVLMRIVRGTGVRGLIGIRMQSGTIFRPLLHCDRDQLTAYLQERNISFLDDPSNADMSHPRNYIRRNIVPHFKYLNPAILGAIQAMTRIISDEDDWFTEETRRLAIQSGWRGALPFTVQNDRFTKLSRAVLRRLSLYFLYSLPDTAEQRFSKDNIDDLAAFLAGRRRALDLPGRIHCRRQGPQLTIFRKPTLAVNREQAVDLPVPGDVHYRNRHIRTKIVAVPSSFPPHQECLYLNIRYKQLKIRKRKPGDRFRPMGWNQETRLKRFFIGKHVVKELRDEIPLIVDAQDNIVAIPGLGIAAAAIVHADDEKALKITWKEI